MKNKTIILLLAFVCLGFFVAILVALARSAESSSDKLPFDEVWTFQADDRILATPVLVDDQIIFRTADKIYSINALNGSVNWEIASRASSTTINVNLLGKPLVANSKFLLSEEQDNSIGTYSTKTGEKLWTVEGQINDINALELMDDVMIVARHDGNLVVYDLTSHEKLWEVALPSRSPTPVAANTEFVISGAWHALRIYDLKDGRLINQKIYDTSSIWEIVLSGANIFVNHTKDGGDESISSLQLDSLDENWTFHAGKITDPHLSLTGDYLGVFNETLLVLDPSSGNVLWEDDTNAKYSKPAFHENSVFFISPQGWFDKKKICKAEISKGMMADCFTIGPPKVRSYLRLLGPLVTNDLLIVPQDSGIAAFTIP